MCQVGRKKRYPLGFSIDPHNLDRTLERFEHHHTVIGDNGPVATIKIDGVFAGQRPESVASEEASPSFLPYFLGRPGPFFRCRPGSLKTLLFERKPGYHVKTLAKLIVQRLEQSVIAEP
jgi:hypothetical protein